MQPVPCSGNGLVRLQRSAGASDRAIALCKEVAGREPRALWAHRSLGFLLLGNGQGDAAVTAFQVALRGDASNARTWEGLGAAYQTLGRLTAALKVCAWLEDWTYDACVVMLVRLAQCKSWFRNGDM
jgi:Flp pilus assembly protein TadD